MQVSVRTHAAGFPIFTVRSGDNEFELSTFGGQLLSWSKAGVPVMFANREHAILDGATPYRGGAPICFPYFSKGSLMPGKPTLLPQHGRARNSIWPAVVSESDATITLHTTQPSPEGFGPTTFACQLIYRFTDDLEIEAKVSNIGDATTPFQLAVHSYWATDHPSTVAVTGLGEPFLDNLRGYEAFDDPTSDAPHTPPFDRVYPDASPTLRLATERFTLNVDTEGCPGAVLWNPGPNHPIVDLGSPDFVCLESGVVTPAVELLPGGTHNLKIRYRVELLA